MLLSIIGNIVIFIKKGWQRVIWSNLQKSMLAKCGKNVKLANGIDFTYKNVHLGNNIYLGPYNYFISPVAKIYIGDNVFTGPNVMFISGNHDIKQIGKLMIDIEEKKSENYQDICIEEDVWIGSNCIILKGVTIGKGSVIGSGTIIAKDVPKYSIVTNKLELNFRKRFTDSELEKHEQILKESRGYR